METIICCQCNKEVSSPSNRLVQDACGHSKCRKCLLEDEELCKQCRSADTFVSSSVSVKESVIKFENNQSNSNNVLETISNKVVSDTSLKKRIRTVKNQKVNKRQKNPIHLPSHINFIATSLKYQCTICDKSFSTKAHIKYHNFCNGVKPYKCETCNKEFNLKTQLDLHRYRHNETKQQVCTICKKAFFQRRQLARHVNIVHSTVRPYVCSDCGKAFRSKESLRLHSILHKNEKPYACKFCSSKFTNSSNLKKHLVSHSSVREHMCDQCGKQFKLKGALALHKKSHSERAYHCSFCSKAFYNNKDLQRHNLIHIEAKAFTCSVCSTSFRRRDNLVRHIRNTHPGVKGEVITNALPKPAVVNERPKPVDNPNAIKVITASPLILSKSINVDNKADNRVNTVINGPIKLACKTPAFKSNYNINRDVDFVAPSSQMENKPNSPLSAQPQWNKPEDTSIHYETSFQNRKHAMIKNIKFKVPIQYTLNNNNTSGMPGSMNESSPLMQQMVNNELENQSMVEENGKVFADLKPMANVGTSVIVNANQANNNFNEFTSMHWRRRTAQNFNIKN